MAAGAGQNKIVAVDLIETQPIGVDAAVAVSAAFACQRMILQVRRERRASNKQTQDIAQLKIGRLLLGKAGWSAGYRAKQHKPKHGLDSGD
jgi:hypothetical protein